LPFYAVFFLVLLFSQSFGQGGIRCGIMNIDPQKKVVAKKAYSTAGRKETVHTRKSSPFIIHYTKEGNHAATETYIDSLETYLHQAYKLIKDSLGMKRGISGAANTYFYEKSSGGLYPIEVLDIGIAEPEDGCDVLGAVFTPYGKQSTATQMYIENDFIYGTSCKYGKKGDPMTGNIWKTLKETTFHELYHSFQTAYSAISSNNIFWMEAGATGVEEIAVPSSNDYIGSLRSVFQGLPRTSINSFDSYSSSEDRQKFYSYATLYLFLFSKIDPKFDSAIWNYFSKNSKDKFPMQLARLADSLGYDPEDLFHEYVTKIFYSGSRANSSPYGLFWPDDMPSWPDWKTNPSEPQVLPAGTFDFIRAISGKEPSTDSVTRKTPLDGNLVWAISRLLDSTFVPPPPKIEFAAYPNPWNPKQNPELHFSLPEKTDAVEIRTSNGALLERVKGEAGKPLDWQPKKTPAPGILYYRALPYGKNKVLIVSY